MQLSSRNKFNSRVKQVILECGAPKFTGLDNCNTFHTEREEEHAAFYQQWNQSLYRTATSLDRKTTAFGINDFLSLPRLVLAEYSAKECSGYTHIYNEWLKLWRKLEIIEESHFTDAQ